MPSVIWKYKVPHRRFILFYLSNINLLLLNFTQQQFIERVQSLLVKHFDDRIDVRFASERWVCEGKVKTDLIKELGGRVHLPGSGEGATGGGKVFEPLGPVEYGEVELGRFLETSVRMGFNGERFEER